MAREIITFCDNHDDDDGRVPGVTCRVDIGDGPFEADLCEPCRKELIGPLEDLQQSHGRDVAGGDEHKKLRCPWCPRSLSSPRTLRDHVDTKHPESVSDFVAGLISRRGSPTSDGDGHKCPECGKACAAPQGLAAHRRRAHGIEGTSPATLAKRRAQG